MQARALTMPRVSLAHVLRGGEFVLVVALGLAVARLFWLLVTPLGPVGQWQAAPPLVPDAGARAALIERFDPFGSVEPSAEEGSFATDLVLHGVRTSGPQGGGAILALPDGTQASFALGDEVVPGVRLVEVGTAHVVLERGGTRQQLVMEGADAPDAIAGGVAALSGESLPFTPRVEDGAVTGFAVTAANPALTAAANLRVGDVIVSIGNRPISSADDLAQLQRLLQPGARITLGVQRGAEVIPVVANL